jgi:hypothetical protein
MKFSELDKRDRFTIILSQVLKNSLRQKGGTGR